MTQIKLTQTYHSIICFGFSIVMTCKLYLVILKLKAKIKNNQLFIKITLLS